MRHVMAIQDDELFERVKASAERNRRTMQAEVELLLDLGLRVGPPPVLPQVAVVEPTKADLLAGLRSCGSCGHEQRKHEPQCIMMGCTCRKFSG
jgi:hypothetical protein